MSRLPRRAGQVRLIDGRIYSRFPMTVMPTLHQARVVRVGLLSAYLLVAVCAPQWHVCSASCPLGTDHHLAPAGSSACQHDHHSHGAPGESCPADPSDESNDCAACRFHGLSACNFVWQCELDAEPLIAPIIQLVCAAPVLECDSPHHSRAPPVIN